MTTGPQQQRLDLALQGTSAATISTSSGEWTRCANMLTTVASALERASTSGQALGGQTGPAISAAFAQTAVGMAGKAGELARGAGALRNASAAIIKADVGRTEMNRDIPQLPHPGPYVPPVEDNVTATGTYQGALEDHETSFNNREERARQLADALDEDFRASTETMKSIHGEPDPEPPGDDATSGQPGPVGTPPPAGGGRPPTPGGHHTVGVVGEPVHTTHHITPVPTGQETPTPQLPVPTHQVTPPTASPVPVPDHGTGLPATGTTGLIGGTSGGGVSAPLAGGLGVVAGGGLAGAAISGIRGGFAPASAAAGAPARPIGSSTRAGAPGALGRGGAAGTGAPASRPTGGRGAGGRGGPGGRGGAAGAGGGAGGRGGRRGGTTAGAGGAAAGRRGGKEDQDEQGRDRDLFDDGQDWIDDAEAAPGVID